MGSIISNPVAGQQLYAHFEFTTTPALNGVIYEIKLDSTTTCFYNGPLDAGSWMGSCPSPWTATTGNHLLEGIVDPSNGWVETNESNNLTTNNVTVSTDADLIADSIALLDGPWDQSGQPITQPATGMEATPHINFTVNGTTDVDGRIYLVQWGGVDYCMWTGPLVPGQYWVDCNPITLVEGSFSFVLNLDPDLTIPEINNSNNSLNTTINVSGLSDVVFCDDFEDQACEITSRTYEGVSQVMLSIETPVLRTKFDVPDLQFGDNLQSGRPIALDQ